jgi:hypothetical protein
LTGITPEKQQRYLHGPMDTYLAPHIDICSGPATIAYESEDDTPLRTTTTTTYFVN